MDVDEKDRRALIQQRAEEFNRGGSGKRAAASSEEDEVMAEIDPGTQQKLAKAQGDIITAVVDSGSLLADGYTAGVQQDPISSTLGAVSFGENIPPKYIKQIIFTDRTKTIELIVWSAELAKNARKADRNNHD